MGRWVEAWLVPHAHYISWCGLSRDKLGASRQAVFSWSADYEFFSFCRGTVITGGDRDLGLFSEGELLPSVSSHVAGKSGAGHAPRECGVYPTLQPDAEPRRPVVSGAVQGAGLVSRHLFAGRDPLYSPQPG